jgi:hypothetical protein
VSAAAQDDAWAVGSQSALEGTAVIERWDGAQWTLVAHPDPSGNDELMAVAGDHHHAWAVGFVANIDERRTLAERWDGAQWTVVPTPDPGSGTNQLLDVTTAPSSGSAWAVGVSTDESGAQQPLIETC